MTGRWERKVIYYHVKAEQDVQVHIEATFPPGMKRKSELTALIPVKNICLERPRDGFYVLFAEGGGRRILHCLTFHFQSSGLNNKKARRQEMELVFKK